MVPSFPFPPSLSSLLSLPRLLLLHFLYIVPSFSSLLLFPVVLLSLPFVFLMYFFIPLIPFIVFFPPISFVVFPLFLAVLYWLLFLLFSVFSLYFSFLPPLLIPYIFSFFVSRHGSSYFCAFPSFFIFIFPCSLPL